MKTRRLRLRVPTVSVTAGNKRGLVDAGILAAAAFLAWVLIERTDTCTRFFAYVAAHPDIELDSIILAGVFSALGLLVFAVRRWADASRANRLSHRLAHHDPLTGLPNRRSFMDALDRACRGEAPFSCLLFDLDNFKQVNDVRGHIVGDQLLQTIAERLQEFRRADLLLARIGGDEFGVLATSADRDHAQNIAHLIARRIQEPTLIDGRAVETRASVGIARYPEDTARADALFRKADIALYCAKSRGRGAVRLFTQSMEETERRRASVVEALREAVPKREIVPHYQPLVELSTGAIVGYEILARWQSPQLGSVAPHEFIPMATEAGLINALTYSVLEQACAHAVHWPSPQRISLNVAPRQLSDAMLPLQLLAILLRTGMAPHRLEIELTEEALLENDQTALNNLKAMKEQGMTLALDDFGTGYSSLHHLRTLPFDKVKIDRSYIRGLAGSEKSQRMVEAVIAFTHSLGIPLLAEGVETEEQACILRELGCDLAQGWFYGKPVTNHVVEQELVHRAQTSPQARQLLTYQPSGIGSVG
jgi:diguanylate cyclase (GGDEF)-like protein